MTLASKLPALHGCFQKGIRCSNQSGRRKEADVSWETGQEQPHEPGAGGTKAGRCGAGDATVGGCAPKAALASVGGRVSEGRGEPGGVHCLGPAEDTVATEPGSPVPVSSDVAPPREVAPQPDLPWACGSLAPCHLLLGPLPLHESGLVVSRTGAGHGEQPSFVACPGSTELSRPPGVSWGIIT